MQHAWPGLIWLELTGENALSNAALTSIALFSAIEVNGLANIDWAALGSVAGYASLLAVVRTLAALKESNSTDGLLPQVGPKRREVRGLVAAQGALPPAVRPEGGKRRSR